MAEYSSLSCLAKLTLYLLLCLELSSGNMLLVLGFLVHLIAKRLQRMVLLASRLCRFVTVSVFSYDVN